MKHSNRHVFSRALTLALILSLSVVNLVRAQGFGKVQSGVTVTTLPMYGNGSPSNPNLQVTFTLKETAGAPITYSSVTCAILKIVNGVDVYQFDMWTYSNVSLPANGTWTYPAFGSNYIASPGDYKAVARGKVGTGNWFDFQVTGSGVNPRSFTVLPVPLQLNVSPTTTQTVTNGSTYAFSFTVTGLGNPIGGAAINFNDPIAGLSANVITDVVGQASYSRTVPTSTAPASYAFNFVASKIDHATSPTVQRGVQVAPPAAPVLAMYQSVSVLPTRTNPSTIYTLPPYSEYNNVPPVENEKNLTCTFRIINNGNAVASLADWGVLVTGGVATDFRIVYGGGITLLPGQTSNLFDKRGWITENQMNATPTIYTARVQVNINGSWMDLGGAGSSTTFAVYPRPALSNGMLVKRPRNVNSTDPNDAKVYYYQNNTKWEGTTMGFNGLFPSWESEYYVYPIATIAGLAAPVAPSVNNTLPMVVGRNMLYKSGIDVYIIEPEPATTAPLKSRLFDDEAAFYTYGYTAQHLSSQPIALSSTQVSWLQSQYPQGSVITSASELFGNPVNTPVVSCAFNSTTCASPGNYHTAIDYGSASGSTIKSSARGTVASVTVNGQSDHGMGNCVIVGHQLLNGGIVYSLYAHLISIASGIAVGATVVKGQTIGVMGGSGYGNPNYWATHLHFEIKDAAVLHNPSGSGSYWGYTPTSATNFGYHNPAEYIGLVRVGTPLPVQLAQFTANVVANNTVLLNWRTISEINNYGFFVQKKRSEDSSFATIPGSFVAGHGTTNEPRHYTYIDSTVQRGRWSYRLRQIDLDGTVHYSEPVQVNVMTSVDNVMQPQKFSLDQNYPNPFNPKTKIKFSIPVGTRHGVTVLKVYDLLGREVRTLINDNLQPGSYEVTFDAAGLASGVYFCRLRAGEFTETRCMLLLR